MRPLVFCHLSFIVFFLPPDGHAQNCVASDELVHVVGRLALPSNATVLAADGEFVYLERSAGLDVFDVSDPRQPTLSGRLDSSCCTEALVFAGDFAFGTNGSQDITVLDVSNRLSPAPMGSVRNVGDISAIVASSGGLYVASDSGLTVYDITNPIEPRRVGGIESPDITDAQAIAVRDDFAHILARTNSVGPYSEYLVIEISNPQLPVIRSSLELLLPNALATAGTHSYVSTGYGRVEAVDVTDPDAPRVVGAIDVVDHIDKLTVDGERAYLHSETAITRVVDVQDPTEMGIVGFLESRGSVVIDGHHTFGIHRGFCRGNDWRDFVAIDTSKPLPPSYVGRHDIAGRHIAMDGQRAYVAKGFAFEILDISKPEFPVRVGGLETTAPVVSIDARGDYVYAASGDQGVFVYDVSQPSAPRQVAQVETPHFASIVTIQDDLAYVADHEHISIHNDTTRILVFDLATPSEPTLVGLVPFSGFPRAMAVEGSNIGVVEFVGHIIDVSDPTDPLYRGAQIIWDGAGGVDVNETRAYVVATTHGCLDVIDFSGETLSLKSQMGSLHGCTDIVLADSYAYVMCQRGGLKVIDLSNPDAPQVDRIIPLAADPKALAVEGNLIAVTGDSGTEIFLANCPTSTGVGLSSLTASATESSVLLQWLANSEDFADFSVFRAVAGVEFAILNLHAPIPGRGPWKYLDADVEPGVTYFYKLVAHRVRGGISILGPLLVTTSTGERRLGAIQPNPTTGAVTVNFSLSHRDLVKVKVFDVAGRLVRDVLNGAYPAGRHAVLWDGVDANGRPAASGIYLVRFEIARSSTTRRVVLVR